MRLIKVENSGLYFVADVNRDGKVRLIHFSTVPFEEAIYSPEKYNNYYTLLELHGTGEDINDHHGSRYTYTSPAAEMRYITHEQRENAQGQTLEIRQSDGRLLVTTHIQFYSGLPIARFRNTVTNQSQLPFILDYLSSFVYYGLSAECAGCWDENTQFYIPHNTWHGELQWRCNTPWELGLSKLNHSSLKRLSYQQVGSWSSSEYLPLGVFEDRHTKNGLFWQIEHNGSWYWETSDVPGGSLYLQAGGPNANQHHFWKVLQPGDSFESVPVAVGVMNNGFDSAIQTLTSYRRRIRRPNKDNETLPIIFNDYMNCLMGNPSEERLLPLIDAAADAGCEYFVIDAGWYTDRVGGDDDWWSSIGIWEESKRRFPNGLKFVIDRIRSRGMTPGLWVELEGIGPDCELAEKLPESWFFQIRGKRVKEHNRYQLDFRNSEVRAFARATIDRLVRDYGLGYFKIDYNINAGIGTDYACDSPGDGLLGHNRALLQWLDDIFADYPNLVIENCASGGMRMDYAMLQRLSVQSMSDQTDYRQYACIAAMASTAVTPEQGAVWSYPAQDGDEEEAVFNMVNVLLGRVHQSGFLNNLPPASLARVKEGLRCYKAIRHELLHGLPVFPLGLIHLHSPWAAAGLLCGETLYLSVWRKSAEEDTVVLSLPALQGRKSEAVCLYPENLPCSYHVDVRTGRFHVTLPKTNTARFFRLKIYKEND